MATLAVAASPDRPHMSTLKQAALSLFWFGSSGTHWTIILITTLPAQAQLIGGDAVKGQTLGIVLGFGAFVSMIVAPLFGALSDRIVTRFGRRRPWIVLGTMMNIVGLFGLAYFPRANDLSSLPLYIGAFMWVEFWNNVATAPYSALIPDVVPQDQRGSASGWYGLMNILGTFVGALAPFLFTSGGKTDITGLYYFVAVVLFLSMLGTVAFVKEPAITKQPPPFVLPEFFRGLISPLKDHDFRWVFLTRFLMVMGTFTVQQFLQYYMGDVVKDVQFSFRIHCPKRHRGDQCLSPAVPRRRTAEFDYGRHSLRPLWAQNNGLYFERVPSHRAHRLCPLCARLYDYRAARLDFRHRLRRISIGRLGDGERSPSLRRRLCQRHGGVARRTDLSTGGSNPDCGILARFL